MKTRLISLVSKPVDENEVNFIGLESVEGLKNEDNLKNVDNLINKDELKNDDDRKSQINCLKKG